MDPFYKRYLPQNQCGGAPGRGTDIASHVVRSVVDFASLLDMSLAIVYVDLIKAFDFIIREFALGWISRNEVDNTQRLVKLGLSHQSAAHFSAVIGQDGGIMQQIGVHEHVVALLASLHDSSWFSVENTDSILVVDRGGRQGCTFGGKLFNTIYAVALDVVRDILIRRGVVIHIHYCSSALLWRPSNFVLGSTNASGPGVPLVDVTFVDDNAFFVLARSACPIGHRHVPHGVFVLRFASQFCKGKN